jgi:hypothetical protein
VAAFSASSAARAALAATRSASATFDRASACACARSALVLPGYLHCQLERAALRLHVPRLLDEQLRASFRESSLRGLLRVAALRRASRLLSDAPRRLLRRARRRRARRRRLLGLALRLLCRPRLARARLFLGALRARLLLLGAARLGRLTLLGE